MAKAIYIHIPFCTHICHYCDFNKVFIKGQPVDEYLSALKKEMEMTFEKYPFQEINSIYIGGGTPTALNPKQLEFLMTAIQDYVPLHLLKEFSIEANPGDLSIEKLQVLKEFGVNRLSLGVQTFNDTLLERIGRGHRIKDVYESIDNARKLGFNNISVDLMFALPGQTMEDVEFALNEVFRLNTEHCSAYSLIIEPKTIFYNLKRKGKLRLPSVDMEADMYEKVMEEMQKHGLKQYEISNYAKPGYESLHNLVYWNNDEYYGFGAGAHSYLNHHRRANINPVKKYIDTVEEGVLPVREEIELTKKDRIEEEMFLGLRKNEGVSIQTFFEKYSINPLEYYSEEIEKLRERKLIEISSERIVLTHQGRMLGNDVFMEFIK